ncbi:MAG: hypothetical protein ACHP91_02075 [Burkholderiales bacterium]|jgi:hypothetical protein
MTIVDRAVAGIRRKDDCACGDHDTRIAATLPQARIYNPLKARAVLPVQIRA